MGKYYQKMEDNIFYTLLYAMFDKYRQLFINIDIEEAIERDFIFVRNVYGDEINFFNCRSLWLDKNNRVWCVNQLASPKQMNK